MKSYQLILLVLIATCLKTTVAQETVLKEFYKTIVGECLREIINCDVNTTEKYYNTWCKIRINENIEQMDKTCRGTKAQRIECEKKLLYIEQHQFMVCYSERNDSSKYEKCYESILSNMRNQWESCEVKKTEKYVIPVLLNQNVISTDAICIDQIMRLGCQDMSIECTWKYKELIRINSGCYEYRVESMNQEYCKSQIATIDKQIYQQFSECRKDREQKILKYKNYPSSKYVEIMNNCIKELGGDFCDLNSSGEVDVCKNELIRYQQSLNQISSNIVHPSDYIYLEQSRVFQLQSALRKCRSNVENKDQVIKTVPPKIYNQIAYTTFVQEIREYCQRFDVKVATLDECISKHNQFYKYMQQNCKDLENRVDCEQTALYSFSYNFGLRVYIDQWVNRKKMNEKQFIEFYNQQLQI